MLCVFETCIVCKGKKWKRVFPSGYRPRIQACVSRSTLFLKRCQNLAFLYNVQWSDKAASYPCQVHPPHTQDKGIKPSLWFPEGCVHASNLLFASVSAPQSWREEDFRPAVKESVTSLFQRWEVHAQTSIFHFVNMNFSRFTSWAYNLMFKILLVKYFRKILIVPIVFFYGWIVLSFL